MLTGSGVGPPAGGGTLTSMSGIESRPHSEAAVM